MFRVANGPFSFRERRMCFWTLRQKTLERAQKRFGEKVERERERERERKKRVVFFVVLSSSPLWFKKRPKKDQTKQKREYLIKAQHHP